MNAQPEPSTAGYQPPGESAGVPEARLEECWEQLLKEHASDPRGWLDQQAVKSPELRDHLTILSLFFQARQEEQGKSGPSGAAPTPSSAEEGQTDEPALREGTWLGGKLRILGLLDAGGMGEVYVAWHEPLGCEVAVKVLPRRLAQDPTLVARFRGAIQAQARTGSHPHIAAIMDAGEEQGLAYLVMEYVPGEDLKKYVTRCGALPWREACAYIRQAALGLEQAHRQGIIHRDLKPSNLLRTPDGQIKILDWGLARYQGQEPLTLSGAALGTPGYMSPEQACDAKHVDERSDLYSLGCTFWYLLTGKHHLAEKAPGLRALNPDVPSDVAELLARLLAERREDRPQSAAKVAIALAAFLDPLKPGAPSSLPSDLTERRQRRRRWIAAAIIGFALLAGLAFLAGWHWWGKDDGPRAGIPGEAPPQAVPLQEARLDVTHFATLPVEGKLFAQPRGVLGLDSFTVRLDDSVTLEAELPRPAYAFLIAFRPDGKDDLCFPEQEDQPPLQSDRPRYPWKARAVHYGLNEGTGLWVFAVVASSRPLPAYRDWRAQRGPAPWGRHDAPAGAVWYDDGAFVETRTPRGRDRSERGKGLEVAGRAPVVRLTDWLRQAPDAEAVAAVGFVVLPKEKR